MSEVQFVQAVVLVLQEQVVFASQIQSILQLHLQVSEVQFVQAVALVLQEQDVLLKQPFLSQSQVHLFV